jgi:integrase
MTIEALAAVLFGLILYDDDLAVLHVIAEGEGIADPESFAAPRLRAKEACELEWSQVEFGCSAALHARRAKKGKPAVHPIRGDELRMLTALRKEYPDSGYVFTTERGTPFTLDAITWRGPRSPR